MVEKLTIPSEQWRSLSHYERRLLCSKHRRSLKRKKKAREKEIQEKEEEQRLQAIPGYYERLKNEELQEEEKARKAEILRQHEHELWLKREAEAQKRFREQRELEEKIKSEREQREKRIKEEWEAMEKKDQEETEKKKKQKKAKEALLREATSDDGEEPWHNPLAPSNDSQDYGTEKDARNCSFYLKTGACRFGDRCSKFHPLCEESTTMLVPNMFGSLGFMEMMLDERDSDVALEYEEREIYQHFKEFYDDVFPEFEKAGKVIQFKVCCNYEPHLRGNVYVQYRSEEECVAAMSIFNGRWYAEKQLSCELCHVKKWKTAICGLFGQNRCPKGKHCNFLHVFRNPGGAFARADLDLSSSPSRRHRHSPPSRRNSYSSRRQTSVRHEQWSQRSYRTRSRSRERRYRSRSRERRHRSRSRERSHRSRSRDNKHRSRSRERRRDRKWRSRSKSKERSRDRMSRSRSRDKRSRSRSRDRRSRSRSNDRQSISRRRGRKPRSKSRSRSPSKERTSRLRSKDRSRSNSSDKRSRSNSKERSPRLSSNKRRSRSKSKEASVDPQHVSQSPSRDNDITSPAKESPTVVEEVDKNNATINSDSPGSGAKLESPIDTATSTANTPAVAETMDPVVDGTVTSENNNNISENNAGSSKVHKKHKKHKKRKHKKHKEST